MELSLRFVNDEAEGSSGDGSGGDRGCIIEREHMFDKVVTPSDVGKLNRLVIPKQHAEKYFPLDSSTNEKGLILNFEDIRNGKAWCFRYSYWNSSQSYVMTKGWSRFVKEKKLDAGDIVSFQRGAAESAKDRLYIDWRHRPDEIMPYSTSFPHLNLQNRLLFPPSPTPGVDFQNLMISPFARSTYNPSVQNNSRWTSSTGHQYMVGPYRHRDNLHNLDYRIQPYYNHDHQNYQGGTSFGFNGENLLSGSVYCIRPTAYNSSSHDNASGSTNTASNTLAALQQAGHGVNVPLVLDSVPINVPYPGAAYKRFRLFGVNMECPIVPDQDPMQPPFSDTHFPAPHSPTVPSADFSRGKATDHWSNP